MVQDTEDKRKSANTLPPPLEVGDKKEENVSCSCWP